MVIFSYGSNMCTARLRERAPSARSLGRAQLRGHRLRWHKRSVDGSGKCDAEPALDGRSVVWGVIFEIESSELRHLDLAEGLHQGYERVGVNVETARRSVQAQIYRAADSHKDADLKPYDWYQSLVVAGAREHGLPAGYIEKLESVPSRHDANEGRRKRASRLLG